MKTSISFDPEARLVVQLLALLEEEQSALMSFQLDTIERLLDEKTQLLNQLGKLTHERYQALAGNGFESNEAGMKRWMDSNPESKTHADWQSFQHNLAQSKETNRVNGILVTKQFNRNQQILNALNGSGTGNFYGPNGQAAVQPGMRGGIIV